MQVEHGITEFISGIDLVNWQLQLQIPELPVSPGVNLARSQPPLTSYIEMEHKYLAIPSHDQAPGGEPK